MADPVETTEDEVVVTEEVVTEAEETTTEVEVEATETETETEEQENFLDLSDEDFENLEVTEPVSEEDGEETVTEPSDEEIETASTTETGGETEAADAKGAATETAGAAGSSEASTESEAAEVKTEAEKTTEAKPSTVLDTGAAKEATPLEVDDATAVAAYKEIFAPFKANGKTVQVRNKDEAIRLMQMGAGYTKTMMELKPQLTQVRTLKNNGIDDATLNYLIELKNGNPDAVKKLVRESGIDPLDIETGEAGQTADASYRPKDYRASETQVEFELAVAQVATSDSGKAVLESVREWDGQSREVAYKDPAILGVLTDQKQAGIYDQIVAQVDHERMLGNLKGVSFLDAYQQVGTIMSTNGLLKGVPAPVEQTTTVTETVTTGTPAQQTATPGAEPKVLARKAAAPKKKPDNNAAAKAVAPVNAGVPPKSLPANPMNMSDEDFANLEGLEHLV